MISSFYLLNYVSFLFQVRYLLCQFLLCGCFVVLLTVNVLIILLIVELITSMSSAKYVVLLLSGCFYASFAFPPILVILRVVIFGFKVTAHCP